MRMHGEHPRDFAARQLAAVESKLVMRDYASRPRVPIAMPAFCACRGPERLHEPHGVTEQVRGYVGNVASKR